MCFVRIGQKLKRIGRGKLAYLALLGAIALDLQSGKNSFANVRSHTIYLSVVRWNLMTLWCLSICMY